MESILGITTLQLTTAMYWSLGAGLVMLAITAALGTRYIPHHRVGIVEKLWSMRGAIPGDQLIATADEAGYQADILRGGVYFFYWRWQYRIHKVRLTVVPQGKIGYVFARDGTPLLPQQTLGHVVDCSNFQDARTFLTGGPDESSPAGQRGRQRAILREGVYAINLALFVVMTEQRVYQFDLGHDSASTNVAHWHEHLLASGAYDPVIVGGARTHETGEIVFEEATEAGGAEAADKVASRHRGGDNIAIVTIHDGPALEPGQIIAPPVAATPNDTDYHNNYQDVEAFLRAGGRRGRQFVPITDGTYFINRWFATVELMKKTIVPIGHVGVVVSYFGKTGNDQSGESFRHGERVGEGERGVRGKTLIPGKYPFNTYAGRVHLVPTTNFVLHWITGRTEQHRYDESLKSIDLVTADAYEPVLPLSVVVHIDYEKAASVVQRFGDVKKLITQTLDPLLSSYFRDIAHKKKMLELLHERDEIQDEARAELKRRFAQFDIELVDVLIGKPDTAEGSGEIETLLEQLRLRQLSREQVETYQHQCKAAEQLKTLHLAQAKAEKQTELTNSLVEVEIAENRGAAELALVEKRSRQTVVTAEADARKELLMAEAQGKSKALLGEGQSKRVSLEGQAEARVLEQKIESYGDPRLYALSLLARHLSKSRQPLVPERLFVGGSSGDGKPTTEGMLGTLLNLLVAEKTGMPQDGVEETPVEPAIVDESSVEDSQHREA